MARMTKTNFWNNKNVWHNCSELHSCMKICHGKNIDGDHLLTYAWKYQRDLFSTEMLSMEDISKIGKELNENFTRYFKIIVR